MMGGQTLTYVVLGSGTIPLTSFFILLFLGITFYVVYQTTLSPLARTPGPFWAASTSLWKLVSFRKGNYHETILALHEKYGKVVRIAPTEVIISDSSAIRSIYSTTQGKDFHKTDYYDAFTAFRPTIFGQRDPELHAKRKRIVSHGYSMKALQSMENFIQDRLQVFLTKMAGFAASSEEVDLGQWCHFFAFDVIGEIAFSEGFGMLESGVEDEHISLINNQMEFGSTIGMMPSLLPYTRWKFLPIPWLRRVHSGRERLKELTQCRVERRMEKVSNRRDLLGRLLEAKDPITGQMLDPIDLRTEAFSSIVAGSDSTSSALSYTFYHILNHPEVYKVLTNELRDAFPDANLKNFDTTPTYADFGKLAYLQACIKESLRLTSPAAMHLPRYVPKGGRVIAGTYFPAKTTVGISALPIHLSTEIFGSDAAQFNPRRWINGSGSLTAEQMSRYWIPFGIGSRQCIGKNVALIELVKMVGTLLLYFDIENVQVGGSLEIPESESYFFTRMKDPLNAIIRFRSGCM